MGSALITFIIRRILFIIPILILISIISFIIILAPPGDILTTRILELQEAYGNIADEQIAALRHRYGLDQPLFMQYYKWIEKILLQGDFGMSFEENRPVKEILLSRIPPTMLITTVTLLFIYIVAIPIGVYSAVKQYSFFDYIFTFFAFIGIATPNFLLALVLMYIFFESFGWSLGGLYSQGFQNAPWSLAKLVDLSKHLVLPVIVLGTAGTAGLVRVLRGTMLDEMKKAYVQTARSKGLSERVVDWKHVFRIAVLPIISTIGWLLPAIISGEAITSIVLNLPTTGVRLLDALKAQDMYVAGSFILILSTLTIIGTLISDILLATLDPRIRYD